MDSPVTGQGQPGSSSTNKMMSISEALVTIRNADEIKTNLLRLSHAAILKLVKEKKQLKMDLAEAVMDPEQFEERVEDSARLEINHASYQEIINSLEMERDNDKRVIKELKMQLRSEKSQFSEEEHKEGGDKARETVDNLKETEDKDDGGLKVIKNEVSEMAEINIGSAVEWEVKMKGALSQDQ
ncbi:hypothetical protein DBV05_g8339 [Lasiodiplodia theobromae]|uniref:Uncharacterized protein n=1 Tax=Lasiodiplodia theobromae TaxID=45133 RepID=A0A5N5D5Q5_9PEZI|nr:hypothetical protein DBV05_g8339 [Lasiodiplodia theobromae]